MSEQYRITYRECPDCEGAGEVWQEFVTAPPYICHGGWYECQRCGGEGVVTDDLEETDDDRACP